MPDFSAGPATLVSIVDDDPSVRRALRRLIELAGFAVETFASGKQALDGSLPARVACMVVDVYLGDMTGFELQRLLVARDVEVPMIFITAHDEAATWEQARRAGAAAYLPKPVDGEVLVSAIHAAIGDRRD
jgi:FixJ family two-component response regulator